MTEIAQNCMPEEMCVVFQCRGTGGPANTLAKRQLRALAVLGRLPSDGEGRTANPKKKGGAPKGNKFVAGNPDDGRPTLYRTKYADIARRMCEQSATNADLADQFEVGIATICAWQVRHKEFFESCEVGKATADARVERALYERAVGYTFGKEEIKVADGEIHRVPAIDGASMRYPGMAVPRWS